MKRVDNEDIAFFKKDLGLIVILVLLIFTTTIVATNWLPSVLAQVIPSTAPPPRPEGPSHMNDTIHTTAAMNPNQSITGVSNSTINIPNIGKAVPLGKMDLKTLKELRIPTPVLKKIHPPLPIPSGNSLQVIQAEKRLKLYTKPNATVSTQRPINLTANDNNKTTLLKNDIDIHNLAHFLFHLDSSRNITPIADDNSHFSPNTFHDPIFVNTIGGFDGLNQLQSGGFFPPDVQLAVGPNNVVEMVNLEGEIFTKHGSPVSGVVNPFPLSSFPFSVPTNDALSDPRIIYDAISGRWFASILDETTNSVRVAVSSSNDPTGAWSPYNFPFGIQSSSGTISTPYCPDQPEVGISDDKFGISANDFTNHCAGSYQGAQYVIVSKSDLINGVTATFQQSQPDTTISGAIDPVQSLSSTSTLYMVSVGANGNDFIQLFSFTGSVPNAVRNYCALCFPIATTQQPLNATEPGITCNQQLATTCVNTGDARVLDAALYGGKLWLTFNDACTPAGDSQPRSCFRLDQIDATGSTVLQDFKVGAAGIYYYYPALRLDTLGNLNVIFGYSSANVFPSLLASGQAVGATPSTIDQPVIVKSGSADDTTGRYGDYFGAGLDPANPSIVWVNGEYHSSANFWSTFISQITRFNVWSGYASLGGYTLGDPAVTRNSDGRLEVFVIGADHALYHNSQMVPGSSTWTGYSPLGGYIISNPIVAQNSDGRLEVFVIGSDHAVYHESQTTTGSSTWTGFVKLGGYTISNPTVARNSDGRLELFVIGSDHALYHDFQLTAGSTTSWSGFAGLGGIIISNPVVAPNADGRLEVFVIGSDHALYHDFQSAPSSSNGWSGFGYLAGYILGDPAVARNSDGRLEVFVIGSDNALYHNFQTNPSSSLSWSGYGYLGGVILANTNPAVALNSQGQLQVFIVAANDAIFYKFEITSGSSSWTEYIGLGGFVISNPVVATNSDGRLELFVIGSDHALYHNFQLS